MTEACSPGKPHELTGAVSKCCEVVVQDSKVSVALSTQSRTFKVWMELDARQRRPVISATAQHEI